MATAVALCESADTEGLWLAMATAVALCESADTEGLWLAILNRNY